MKRRPPDSKPHGALTIKQSKNGMKAYFCGMIQGEQNIRLLQELAKSPRLETTTCHQLLEIELRRQAEAITASKFSLKQCPMNNTATQILSSDIESEIDAALSCLTAYHD
jgi:hypothetical protein